MVRPPHRGRASVVRAMKASGAWSATELRRWKAWITEGDVLGLSSTQARERLSRGGGEAALSKLLPAPVRAYIAKHGLYAD
jgi:nicotinic acid mononucleotide adenylyltransferase